MTAFRSRLATFGVLGVLGCLGCSGSTTSAGSSSSGGASGVAGSANAGGMSSPGGAAGVGAGTSGAQAAGGASNGSDTGASGSAGASPVGGSVGAGGGVAEVCAPPAVTLAGADAVVGELLQFNDNGSWSWFSDERAVVDAARGKLIVGSVASGGARSGNIEAVIYDLTTGSMSEPVALGNLPPDDHDAPALSIRSDGKYVALWAGHRLDCNTYYSVFDGTAWTPKRTFDWTANGCPWDEAETHKITYSNAWYMGGTLFDIARSVGTTPGLLASGDNGETWSYFGRLLSNPPIGFVAGYYKFWGNNTDRIDFVGTEGHPRDVDNNLWHGYMKDRKVHDSAGAVVNDALGGTSAESSSVSLAKYTQVFKAGSTIGGLMLDHAWNHDVVRYADGTLAILGQARVAGTGTDDPDKRLLYFRFDGTAWKATYLAKAGPKLFVDEPDFTGLGALVPDDPTTIYISTPYDPTTDALVSGGQHEIWRGTTCDQGATFQWTAVTANSTQDNIRPVVPRWDARHTALLWMRGNYVSSQNFIESIVGTISVR